VDSSLSNKGINDLATSPDNPLIVASASDDTTIRIWSLTAAHEKQPCVCILGGESHSYDLLSVVCMALLEHFLSRTSLIAIRLSTTTGVTSCQLAMTRSSTW
jgi:WD40 repeat protein